MVDTAGGHNLMNLRTSKWQRASKSMHRKGHLTTTPLLEQCQHVPARSSCLVFCSLLSWAICEKSDNTLDFWFKRVCFQHFAGIRPAKRQRRSVEDWCGAGHGPGLDFWIRKWMRWMAEIRPKRGSAGFWSWGRSHPIGLCSTQSRTAARCPWPPSVQLNDQFAPIFVRNFWSNFLFSKYLTDSNGPWYGGRNLYESVISLLCFRIFLIEI